MPYERGLRCDKKTIAVVRAVNGVVNTCTDEPASEPGRGSSYRHETSHNVCETATTAVSMDGCRTLLLLLLRLFPMVFGGRKPIMLLHRKTKTSTTLGTADTTVSMLVLLLRPGQMRSVVKLCLSACPHGRTSPNFVHVACGRVSLLFWRRCDTMYFRFCE